MEKIIFADKTLREAAESKSCAMSFKEKIEAVKILDSLGADIIELPAINNEKADGMLCKTVAGIIKNSTLSIRSGFSENSLEQAFSCVKNAPSLIISVALPVSPVGMEYICHKKPAALLERLNLLVKRAKSFGCTVEFTASDATRSEPEFLYSALRSALEAGADKINICDDAGVMLPCELSDFISGIYKNVPEIKSAVLGVEISDNINMAAANAFEALKCGAREIKTAVGLSGCTELEKMAALFTAKGDKYGFYSSIKTSEINHASEKIRRLVNAADNKKSVFESFENEGTANLTLDKNDDITAVSKAVAMIGYELSAEDNVKIYEAFLRIAAKKDYVGTKELDAIVASTAMQVPASYKIVSYVINSGNIINATANLCMEKDGKQLRGVYAGDGPIDAAFLAIEQIIGHHYELDDFQIQAVTEGREAMGSALVKLRSDTGRLYSGNGISTDIIGASIRAYISALNKMVFEENL